jgi:hypothetical protein
MCGWVKTGGTYGWLSSCQAIRSLYDISRQSGCSGQEKNYKPMKISLLTTCRNREKTLRDAIEMLAIK